MSCIYYLVQTRNIGTPFNKSLYNFQRKIKEEAATQRKNIFVQGIVVSAILKHFGIHLKIANLTIQ